MKPLRVGIVAAEPSGDLLAAGLMARLHELHPDVRFEGIGGPGMLEQQLDCWEPMDTLSVMGLVEVLKHLPRLLKLRKQVLRRWLSDPPDVFIGVDAPDFNLTIERQLREAGVPTVHYVSPTVWAWRPGRVKKLRPAIDLLLTIFPFEQSFLQQHGINAVYVGHTLAAEMPLQPDREAAREKLAIAADAPVLAVLPGSRMSEVSRLSKPFLQTAAACADQLPGLQIVIPLVNQRTEAALKAECAALGLAELSVKLVMQDSRSVLAAADVVLTASGTATFEGLLSKRPMVVGYKLNALTYWIARFFRLVNIDHMAMANLLAGERLAPEFLQSECEPEKLLPAVMHFFQNGDAVSHIEARYTALHQQLRTDTDTLAAKAVLQLLQP